jgi:hypothetical protein
MGANIVCLNGWVMFLNEDLGSFLTTEQDLYVLRGDKIGVVGYGSGEILRKQGEVSSGNSDKHWTSVP